MGSDSDSETRFMIGKPVAVDHTEDDVEIPRRLFMGICGSILRV